MTTVHRFVLLLAAALLAAVAGGCASTAITSAWRDPALTAVAEVVRVTARATGEALKARG